MIDAETALALIAVALIALAIAAIRIGGAGQVFLVAQVAYWSLSYIARPVVLLWVQPFPAFGDNVADPRLNRIGYEYGIGMVLQPVVFGLCVYAAVVVAYAIWSPRRYGSARSVRSDTDLTTTLLAVYVLGLFGRAAAYLSGTAGSAGEIESSDAILDFVAQLASMAAIGLIIYLRPANRRVTLTVLGVLLILELMWTLTIQSKTPIMSAALALALRFCFQGWTRGRVGAIVAVSALGISAFGLLQAAIKPADQTQIALMISDGQYPSLVRPFLSILRRFDLLEAATDAYYFGGRVWLSPWEVLRHSLESLAPAQLQGGEKFRSGVAWANEVRGASVDMSRVSVSLADGNINEGYVFGGYLGVAVGVLFTFALLHFAVRALLARHIFFIALGLAVTEAPVLFERGILGSMEVIGKGLQSAVLIWLIGIAVRQYRRHTTPPGDGGSGHQAIGAFAGPLNDVDR